MESKDVFYVKITNDDGVRWYASDGNPIYKVKEMDGDYYINDHGTIYKTHAEIVHLQELPFAIGQEIEVRGNDAEEWERREFVGIFNDKYIAKSAVNGHNIILWEQARAIPEHPETEQPEKSMPELIDDLQSAWDEFKQAIQKKQS
ncbi:MAG: hypothetical protein GWN62_16770 [Aliifodinibius sp.]|nr:hypothetical protein [Fodinibius sp.]